MNNRWLQIGLIVSALLIVVAQLVAQEEGPSDYAVMQDVKGALEDNRIDDAYTQLKVLAERHPEAGDVAYNLGVLAHQMGNLDDASAHFEQALSFANDPQLRSRAAYNLGTTALKQLSAEQNSVLPQADKQVEDSIDELNKILRQYREALDADSTDVDAAANAELTQRFLTHLQQQQEQQQQQDRESEESENDQSDQGESQEQQQSQQSQEDQQDQQGQESGTGEQQPDQQDDSQQQQQQPGADQQDASEEDAETSSPPVPEQQHEEPPEDLPGASDEIEQDPEPIGREAAEDEATESQEGENKQRRRMTKEEASRLLQRVRDRMRQRLEEQAKRAQELEGRRIVEKDW